MARPWLRAALAAAMVALSALPAAAHEEHRVGPLRLSIGWSQEPAFAGLPNAVEVRLTRDGEPADVGNARFSVAVLFGEGGSGVASEPLTLQAADGEEGVYEAFLIPTRPGTYTFHLTGRVAGRNVDEEFTSGEQTFDDVESPAEAQFPERDPTAAEISDRLERIDARLAALARDEAGGAGALPTVLAAAALLAAVAALAVTLLRRRT